MSGQLAIIKESLSKSLAGVEMILPEGVKMEAFVRCAATAIATSPDLQAADPDSVVMSLTKCAADGLVPDSKEAALISFNTKVKQNGKDVWIKKAQYLPMIDGVIKRARMSGQIATMSSKAVFEGDEFDYWMDENGEHIKYRPSHQGGTLKLAFAFAKLTNGELIVEVMSKADVDKVRASSKTGTYGPWADWYDRMACKTVFHRLAKRLPNASEIVAMCEQGMNMSFDPATEKDITPMVVNPIEKLKSYLEGKDPEQYLKWLKVESLDQVSEDQASAAVLKLEKAQ